MSRVPALSRRVLDALMEMFQAPASTPSSGTGVGRMFSALRTMLQQQDMAFVALDCLAAQVDDGEEAAAAYRAAVARAERLVDASADAAAALLLAPIERACDLQLKLMVLIAACEPHPDDAYIFPGLYLRALLAELRSRPVNIEKGFIDLERHNANS